jgi:hypothetical protein
MLLCRPCSWVAGEARQGCEYLKRLDEVFGYRFAIWLVSCYLGVKGALGRFVALGQLPYFLAMEVTAADYQIYGSVALTPWALKALFGPLSDSVSLCGYHKRYWIVVMSLLGVGAFVVLASVDFGLEQAPIAAVLFFAANADASMLDILGQGKYAEMMVKHPDTSSDLVTWVWCVLPSSLHTMAGLRLASTHSFVVCAGVRPCTRARICACMLGGSRMNYHAGALGAATLVGPLADLYNPRVIFWICVPLAAQIIPFSLWPGASKPRGFLPEKKSSGGVCHVDTRKLCEQPKLFTMAAVMAVLAVGMALVNLLGTQTMQLVYALASSACLCALGFLCMVIEQCSLFISGCQRFGPPRRLSHRRFWPHARQGRTLARANLYMFLAQALYISVRAPISLRARRPIGRGFASVALVLFYSGHEIERAPRSPPGPG